MAQRRESMGRFSRQKAFVSLSNENVRGQTESTSYKELHAHSGARRLLSVHWRELGKKRRWASSEVSRDSVKVNRRVEKYDNIKNWFVRLSGHVLNRFSRMFVNHAADRARVFVVIVWDIILLLRPIWNLTARTITVTTRKIFQPCEGCCRWMSVVVRRTTAVLTGMEMSQRQNAADQERANRYP